MTWKLKARLAIGFLLVILATFIASEVGATAIVAVIIGVIATSIILL